MTALLHNFYQTMVLLLFLALHQTEKSMHFCAFTVTQPYPQHRLRSLQCSTGVVQLLLDLHFPLIVHSVPDIIDGNVDTVKEMGLRDKGTRNSKLQSPGHRWHSRSTGHGSRRCRWCRLRRWRWCRLRRSSTRTAGTIVAPSGK